MIANKPDLRRSQSQNMKNISDQMEHTISLRSQSQKKSIKQTNLPLKISKFKFINLRIANCKLQSVSDQQQKKTLHKNVFCVRGLVLVLEQSFKLTKQIQNWQFCTVKNSNQKHQVTLG